MDDGLGDEPSQYVPLGSVFIAIAIMVWTLVAVWLCFTGPPDGEDAATSRGADFSDSNLLKATSGFADLWLDGKDKGNGSHVETRLDFARLEELLPQSSKSDVKGSLNDVRDLLGKLSSLSSKDGKAPLLASLQLSKDGEKDASSSRSKCDLRTAPSPARASGDSDGIESVAFLQEQLRDKLLLASLGGIGQKGSSDPLAAQLRSRGAGPKDKLEASKDALLDKSSSRGLAGMKKEIVEDFLRQLLQSGRTGKPSEQSEYDNLDKECVRPATMFSMAEHAREIGNKYLQERNFAAAAHCYEVACLLCPPTLPHALTQAALGPWAIPSGAANGNSGHGQPAPESRDEGRNACLRQLATYHCNCSLACLELGRYGDAINEAHAALVLNPQRSLGVKALYRLAVAHANLKNFFEARRCLKRLLDLDPLNEYARALLRELGEEEGTGDNGDTPSFSWIEPPKRAHGIATASRDKAKGRKGKQKAALDDSHSSDLRNGAQAGKDSPLSGFRLDREAGLWQTLSRHGNKLYLLGGTSGEAAGADAHVRGSDELHVLDVDTFEYKLSNAKPPHPCHCHSATVVGTNMIVFGGCGPPLEQPPLVMVLDLLQGKWRVPPQSGIPPRQRQGHSANAVQGDRQMCIFGGIEPTGEQRVARVYNDVHLLDLHSFSWRKMEAAGHKPHARFGHTATNLPGNPGRLLIVGGRDHLGTKADPALSSGFTGLHILDTERRTWIQQPCSGSPPLQTFYHSACAIDDSSILFLGSGIDGSSVSMPIHLLNFETWHWSSPLVGGIGPPAPRVGHVAAAVGTRIYLYGGISMREGQAIVDKSVYVLETSRIARPSVSSQACQLSQPAAPPPQEAPSQEQSQQSSAILQPPAALLGGDNREALEDEFDEDMDDEPELTFEELLEQEKAYFKQQSEKPQFPRAKDAKEKEMKKGRFG